LHLNGLPAIYYLEQKTETPYEATQ
jgi:hypothetical protein